MASNSVFHRQRFAIIDALYRDFSPDEYVTWFADLAAGVESVLAPDYWQPDHTA